MLEANPRGIPFKRLIWGHLFLPQAAAPGLPSFLMLWLPWQQFRWAGREKMRPLSGAIISAALASRGCQEEQPLPASVSNYSHPPAMNAQDLELRGGLRTTAKRDCEPSREAFKNL